MSRIVPRFLIVKMSSLGDVAQAFGAAAYLRKRFPDAWIDWAVEEEFSSIVEQHPLIHRAIIFPIHSIRKRWRQPTFWLSLFRSFGALRENHYDAVFDLQGNCKSGIVTLFSRSFHKAGFGKKSVCEWPNLLATRFRYDISPSINIRLQYTSLVQKFFHDDVPFACSPQRLNLSSQEEKRLIDLLSLAELKRNPRIMVCPGSKWINKQLSAETLSSFLQEVEKDLQCSFLFVAGSDREKMMCMRISRRFASSSIVVERLSVPLWQNLMDRLDLVIAMDSSALHVCGTTSTPSFSIFGPSKPEIFKPLGDGHFSIQGTCPFGQVFQKRCPLLRTCPTGSCIRDLSPQRIYQQFVASRGTCKIR